MFPIRVLKQRVFFKSSNSLILTPYAFVCVPVCVICSVLACACGRQSLTQGIFKHSLHYFQSQGLLMKPEWLERESTRIRLSLSAHAHIDALLHPTFLTHCTNGTIFLRPRAYVLMKEVTDFMLNCYL